MGFLHIIDLIYWPFMFLRVPQIRRSSAGFEVFSKTSLKQYFIRKHLSCLYVLVCVFFITCFCEALYDFGKKSTTQNSFFLWLLLLLLLVTFKHQQLQLHMQLHFESCFNPKGLLINIVPLWLILVVCPETFFSTLVLFLSLSFSVRRVIYKWAPASAASRRSLH